MVAKTSPSGAAALKDKPNESKGKKMRNPCEMQGSSGPQWANVLVELAPWSQPNTGRKCMIR